MSRSHKDKPGETLTLSNATRLLVDARFLLDNNRFAGAFALAVLGVEEIGKALLDGWNADAPLAKPKASFHIQKQTAVASLLVGTLAVRTYPEGSLVDLAGDKKATKAGCSCSFNDRSLIDVRRRRSIKMTG